MKRIAAPDWRTARGLVRSNPLLHTRRTPISDDDYQPELGLAVGVWIIALEVALALAAVSWWISGSPA